MGSSSDIYTAFQIMIPDEGPNSSEDGSGLHSPVFAGSQSAYSSHHPAGGPGGGGHGESTFRYADHLDVHHGYDAPHHHPHQAHPHQQHTQQQHHNPYPPPPSQHHSQQQHQQQQQHHQSAAHHAHQNQQHQQQQHHQQQHLNAPHPPPPPGDRHHHHLGPGGGSSAYPPPPPPPSEDKKPSNTVIACRNCRSRKIRCDSTRPMCNNCVRRNNPCEYDAVPKRRGPDKRPGTRQRSCKKRPAPDDGGEGESASPVQSSQSSHHHLPPPPPQPQPSHHPSHQHPQYSGHSPEIRLADPSPYSMSFQQGYEQRGAPLGYEQKPPQLEMNHRSHWDRLVQNPGIAVIIQEIEFLIEGTAHMLAFIPLAHLSKRLWSDAHRLTVHPAFIYSALALARLMRSSNRGDDNRRAAMAYRSDAVRLIEESQHHRWIDLGLVEGALILAIFESSAHLEYTPANYLRSLTRLDGLIRSLALTSSDQPLANVSRFPEGGVPCVFTPTVGRELAEGRTCDCLRSPAVVGASPRTTSPTKTRPEFPPGGPNGMQIKRFIPPWPQEWTPEQIRAEEARRLCWSALDLVSAYLAQCAVDGRAGGRFWVADSSKWALYFPGEALESISSPSMQHHPHSPHSPSYQSQSPNLASSISPMHLTPKESIWALYCRSMLLWCYTVGMREGPPPSGPQLEDQRAEEVWEAWTEVQAIEDSLDAHKCNLDTGLMYATREYVHK
ncbi:hypothetical protein BKA70DRAFT_1125789 [Coprinopsis sp. MPI-PUGE-AT-0042]|nr:hypothetical protein BKA70DRAFT_1125789 [Coprinopsis sp. MPI-PUGE-AT-0042]